MPHTKTGPTPLTDLEMFELLQLAYPDKFPNDDNDTWEAAMDFAEELSGFEELADLLGRVVMMTSPLRSALSGKLSHGLGEVTINDHHFQMRAVISRDVQL